jgi:hypothetical protein
MRVASRIDVPPCVAVLARWISVSQGTLWTLDVIVFCYVLTQDRREEEKYYSSVDIGSIFVRFASSGGSWGSGVQFE